MKKPEVFHTDNMGIVLLLTLGNGDPLNEKIDFVSPQMVQVSLACIVYIDTIQLAPQNLPFLAALLSHSEVLKNKDDLFKVALSTDVTDVPEHLREIYGLGLRGMDSIIEEKGLLDTVLDKKEKEDREEGGKGGYKHEI